MALRRDPDRSALALFADELRAAREHVGLSREDLAARLNYSGSLVGKIEGLQRVPHADFAARCDGAFGTPGTFARLQQQLRNLPFRASFRPFAAYEEVATSLRTFQHTLVPGLLQTPDYARAVLATLPNTTESELDDLVTARLARQVIFERDDPPLMWAVVDEAVLHRPIGDAKVMNSQLCYLAEMADRPNITIQVIPYSAGGHVGLIGRSSLPISRTPPASSTWRRPPTGRLPRTRRWYRRCSCASIPCGLKPCPAGRHAT